MKKIIKITSICLILTLALSFLVGCSVDKQEVVGTYVGSYEYNGNIFTKTIGLDNDGTYTELTLKNGEYSSLESGDYEIKGSKIRLYDSDSATYHGSWTEYKYKNGTIENNDHVYTKK